MDASTHAPTQVPLGNWEVPSRRPNQFRNRNKNIPTYLNLLMRATAAVTTTNYHHYTHRTNRKFPRLQKVIRTPLINSCLNTFLTLPIFCIPHQHRQTVLVGPEKNTPRRRIGHLTRSGSLDRTTEVHHRTFHAFPDTQDIQDSSEDDAQQSCHHRLRPRRPHGRHLPRPSRAEPRPV